MLATISENSRIKTASAVICGRRPRRIIAKMNALLEPQIIEELYAACEALGQKPVKTQDTPGFVLNYFLIPFNNDAIRLVEQGVADAADIAKGWQRRAVLFSRQRARDERRVMSSA